MAEYGKLYDYIYQEIQCSFEDREDIPIIQDSIADDVLWNDISDEIRVLLAFDLRNAVREEFDE